MTLGYVFSTMFLLSGISGPVAMVTGGRYSRADGALATASGHTLHVGEAPMDSF